MSQFGRLPTITFDTELETSCPKCTFKTLETKPGEANVLHELDYCSYCHNKRVLLTDKGKDMLVFLSRWVRVEALTK